MTERDTPAGGVFSDADNGLARQLARLDEAEAMLLASISHEPTTTATAVPEQAPRRSRRWRRRTGAG
jgi:hypothetical protein